MHYSTYRVMPSHFNHEISPINELMNKLYSFMLITSHRARPQSFTVSKQRKPQDGEGAAMCILSLDLKSRASFLALRQGIPGRCYLDVISPQSGRYQTWPCSTRIRQAHSHGARFQVVLMYLWALQITGMVQQGRTPSHSSPRLWRGNRRQSRGLLLHKLRRVQPSCMQTYFDDVRSISAARTC